MNTLTRTMPMQSLAALSLDTPLETPLDEAPVHAQLLRDPDFIEEGRAYWIGPEAVVSCDWFTADGRRMADVLERAGWMGRTGAEPAVEGLTVEPLNPVVEKGPLMRNGYLFTIWHMAAETVLVGA